MWLYFYVAVSRAQQQSSSFVSCHHHNEVKYQPTRRASKGATRPQRSILWRTRWKFVFASLPTAI